MLTLNRDETLRYLGMASAPTSDAFDARLKQVEDAVLSATRARAHWLFLPFEIRENSTVKIEELSFVSRDLARHLANCSHVILLVATLGPAVDALMRRYAELSPANLVLAQAAAAALIESYCDQCEEKMHREISDATFTTRFSPGYGDLALSTQTQLLAKLDSVRRVGVSLTAAQAMVPSKTVSAIIGVTFAKNSRD